MKTTKIDWCDSTINAVMGCNNGCEYCYAKKLNDRFHFIKKWEEPEFFPNKLDQLKCKNPKAIFMDSMSDFGCWTKEQVHEVLMAIDKNPQHAYIFLTKTNKDIKNKFNENEKQNIFTGKSITKGVFPGVEMKYDFLSIEPLHAPVGIKFDLLPKLKQVIIGAETGNRKGKIKPLKEWVDSIVKQCDKRNVRVFMKESLRTLMGADFRQDKLIWYDYIEGVNNERKY